MRSSPGQHYSLIALLMGFLFISAQNHADGATITFSIGMAYVLDQAAQKLLTNRLFQLVKLGANGVFDPITPGSWVGGDDTLLTQSFANTDGWTSAAAFDITNGTGSDGVFSRQFTFTLGADLNVGDKIGIRWFPTINASDFAITQTTAGLPFGEFTLQATPRYGGTDWVIPAAGSLVSFDPLLTRSYDSINGLDSNTAGQASQVVVPEPGAFSLMGLAAVLLLAGSRQPKYDRPATTGSITKRLTPGVS